jgi:site-specific recombinase XerD
MHTDLALLDGAGATAVGLTDALSSAAGYALAEKSDNTRRAYRSDLIAFSTWCRGVGATALPASGETVAAYLAFLADSGLTVSTIQRRAAAIAYSHKLSGLTSPLIDESVKAVLRGIRRTVGVASHGKAPATANLIIKMIRKLPATLAGKRDRALILLGFAAALRRSELVALAIADVERTGEGVFLHILRGKTDQEGLGASIAVPAGGKLGVLEAVDEWIAAAGLVEGPLFRAIDRHGHVADHALSDDVVALVVKHAAKAARLDPAAFSGHSLRAGFVTSALASGADLFRIMDVTRHREVKTLRIYDRRAKAFDDHPGRKFL